MIDKDGNEIKFTRRNLRVVSNVTRDYDGGYTVEYGDWIVAGPYAAKVDAVKAKAELVAGVPLSQPSDGRFS